MHFIASGGMLACGMATKTINIVKSPLCDTSKIMTATGMSVFLLTYKPQYNIKLSMCTVIINN